jgi:hypothetical protein
MKIQDHYKSDFPTLREWLTEKNENAFTWSIDDRDQANIEKYQLELEHLDYLVIFEAYQGHLCEYDSSNSLNTENLKIIENNLFDDDDDDDDDDLIFTDFVSGYKILIVKAGLNLEDHSEINNAIESILSLEDYPVLCDSIYYCEACNQYMSSEDVEFHYTDNKTECEDCHEPEGNENER